MICVAPDAEVPQKSKKDKLLEPNAEENVKKCIIPSPLQVPRSNKSILQQLALSTAEASIQKMGLRVI